VVHLAVEEMGQAMTNYDSPGKACSDAVRAAAKLLDERKPDWYKPECINLAALNQASLLACVLGQNYGNYDLAASALKLSDRETLGLRGGNNVRGEPHWSAADETYRWRYEITERRARDEKQSAPTDDTTEVEVDGLVGYTRYELPNGKSIFVPEEMVDKLFFEVQALGMHLNKVVLEWEA
jgi:hypothetical protein